MIVYSHEYSSEYYPSAPVVEVAVRHVQRANPEIIVTALVDCGADASMIPVNVLRAVGAKRLGKRQVRGISGFAYSAEIYLATIRLGPHLIRGMQVIAIKRNKEAIVGRDVLNNLVVTLNGLASVTEVEG